MIDDFSLSRLSCLWALDNPKVMWRHDVDNHLSLAVRMARMEQKSGIKATYYVHADTAEYACQGAEFVETVEEILACGHTLGTHVDLDMPRSASVSTAFLAKMCKEQADSLSRWPVGNRVSLHRPPQDAVWRDIPGFAHALSPFWKGRYSSDSRQRFRLSPEHLIAKGIAQVNLHPCWWFLPDAEAESLRRQHEVAANLDTLVRSYAARS